MHRVPEMLHGEDEVFRMSMRVEYPWGRASALLRYLLLGALAEEVVEHFIFLALRKPHAYTLCFLLGRARVRMRSRGGVRPAWVCS